MKSTHHDSPLRRFFAGAAEYIFQARLGVADPPLIDYISDLLTRFVRWDAIYKVRSLSGEVVEQVIDMTAEAEARVGDARRDVHRHIGDFTLFWTGVYPEALAHLRGPAKKDVFIDYCAQGKRAYRIASEIEPSREHAAPGEVLERLSREFEMCAFGLRQVRREWERREDGPSGPRSLLIH